MLKRRWRARADDSDALEENDLQVDGDCGDGVRVGDGILRSGVGTRMCKGKTRGRDDESSNECSTSELSTGEISAGDDDSGVPHTKRSLNRETKLRQRGKKSFQHNRLPTVRSLQTLIKKDQLQPENQHQQQTSASTDEKQNCKYSATCTSIGECEERGSKRGYQAPLSGNAGGEPATPVVISPLPNDPPFTADELLFAQHMTEYFTVEMIANKVIPYVDRQRPLSSRDLTWAATHYFTHVPYFVTHPHAPDVTLNISEAYKMYLDEYKKYRFDSFRRVYSEFSRRVLVTSALCNSLTAKAATEAPDCHNSDLDNAGPAALPSRENMGYRSVVFETTFAQLQFFKFAISFHFIEACEEHTYGIKQQFKNVTRKRNAVRAAEQAITGRKARRAPLISRPEETVNVFEGGVNIKY